MEFDDPAREVVWVGGEKDGTTALKIPPYGTGKHFAGESNEAFLS